MLQWIKNHWNSIVIVLVTSGLCIFMYDCEPKVESLKDERRLVTRFELQIELEQILSTAEIRMSDLDRQDELRKIILQNALLLVEGQPANPVGIITAIAALYGLLTASKSTVQTVKNTLEKRKVNNA